MTKSALGVYTKNAAFTMREAGIRVNGLNMGWTFTPGEDAIMQRSHGASSGWQADYAEMLPLGRLLDPAEVGRAVGYLATEDSAPMTGSIVDFDQVPFGVGDWPPA